MGRNNTAALFTSPVLLDELADVLSRDKFATLLSTRQTTPDYLMQRYGMLARVIVPERIARTVPNDPDDDAVIACAITAQANMIITGDSDLLMLHPFQNIQILKPADALKQIEGIT
jgi:putative PIN family toxin of toxin-antitoxin system